MKALENKWLVVLPGVILTPAIEPVITALEPYFEKAKIKAFVTSGLRTAEDQLRVIRQYLVKKGLDKKYPQAMTCAVHDSKDGEYAWQMAWSNLLNAGVIINPPLPAVLLMDYYNSKNRNRKGLLFPQTAHASGTAFNIGGGGNGVDDEAAVVQRAIDDKVKGLKSFVKERENNAIHCNCTLK